MFENGTDAIMIHSVQEHIFPQPKHWTVMVPFSYRIFRGSDMVMRTSALLSTLEAKEKRQQVVFRGDKHSVLKLSASSESPAFTVEAIVDPASREAQKMAPVLQILRAIANVDIRVYFNCRDQLSDMPVKRSVWLF